MTKLTILMPNYNNEDSIGKALDSILMQKTKYKFKIIISDDASNDNSLKVINSYKQKHKNKIKVLRQNKNLRFTLNMLKLYNEARSEYFCVLDSDDYWIDELKIEKALSFLEEHKNYTSYQGKTLIKQDGTERIYIDYTENHTCLFAQYLTKSEKQQYMQISGGWGQDNIINAPISFPTMGHTSSSIFRNIALHNKHTQSFFSQATRYDIYGGDSFRNFLHLMYGHSYHCTDVDSVYNMHGNGDWSANGEDLQDYRNAVLWHDFWEFSERKFLFLLLVSCNFFRKISNKTNDIKYTNNDNPKQKIPQMIKNYNNHKEAIEDLYKRLPNA